MRRHRRLPFSSAPPNPDGRIPTARAADLPSSARTATRHPHAVTATGTRAGVHPVPDPGRLHTAPCPVEQSLTHPGTPRNAPAHPARHTRPRVQRRRDGRPRPGQGRTRAPALGPRAPPATPAQREVGDRRKDPGQRAHVEAAAQGLAARTLPVPAARPGVDRGVRRVPPCGRRPLSSDARSTRLRGAPRRGPHCPDGGDHQVRGSDRGPGTHHADGLRAAAGALGAGHARLRTLRPWRVPAVRGDWSDTIRSGVIQPARISARSDDVDPTIRAVACRWGYPTD